jgi:hypothetical protein
VDESALRAVGGRLRAEKQALQAIRALTAADVGVLLLKGAALQQLLYGEHDVRDYVDIDLLVDARRWNRALQILYALGYRPMPAGGLHEHPLHSVALGRAGGGLEVDLHHRLHGARGSSRALWPILSRDATEIPLAGATAVTTSLPVTLYHLTVSALPEHYSGPRHAQEWRIFVERYPGLLPAAREVACAIGAEYDFERSLVVLDDGEPAGSTSPAGPVPERLPGLLLSGWAAHLRRAPSWRARGRLVYEVAANRFSPQRPADRPSPIS